MSDFDLNLDLPGLRVADVVLAPTLAVVALESTAPECPCPTCGQPSRHVHSRYRRTAADLPGHDRAVALRLHVRRFRCLNPGCPRSVFCERLPGLVEPHARTTERLSGVHRLIGLALGGEPGSRLARRLAVPTSPDTLLLRVKGTDDEPTGPVRFVGIDDWAFRKGQRYGTIVVDLERGRVIDLLPDREADTVARWLKDHPGVEVITRDRAGAYAKGAAEGAPAAQQVADRWHLLKNLREAVERLFDRLSGPIREALTPPAAGPAGGAATLPPPTAAPNSPAVEAKESAYEPPSHPRSELFGRVHELHRQGRSIRSIAEDLGLARNTVRRYLRAGTLPSRRRVGRSARLSVHREWLDRRIAEGRRNAAELHRELVGKGVKVSPATVRRWVAERLAAAGQDRGGRPTPAAKDPLPTPRQMAFDWVKRPDQREAESHARLETVRLAAGELGEGMRLADEFADLIRGRASVTFDDWLARAEASACPELRRFAEGVRQDEAAVRAAVDTKWSNGPVEGHVNRLKCIKRQMYGRAGLDLLRKRVVNAA